MQLYECSQGAAHLLEHMLFCGSSEFPGENEMDEFWEKAGGQGNASTAIEHTMFYCAVQSQELHGSLTRMVAAAAAPLLRHEMLEREVRNRL